MMSTTAPTPATTPIPVQLSEPEFTQFILPHLSMPKRGPKCKLGYYRVFNLILWVLYTGMQWKCLPVPTDAQGKPAIHYTTVYKVFAKWADDGSLGRRLWRVYGIWSQSNSSTSACCMATGPTPWPKKGRWHRLFRPQAPKGRESHRHHRQPWLCLSTRPRGARQ
jgi:transposase